MIQQNEFAELVKKGVKNPTRIPPYILRRMFPNRFGKWKKENGVVTWNSFEWGDGNNPAQISAINYHMVQALRSDLDGQQFETAAEIGCGYGRATPWLLEYADEVIGIEPNPEMGEYVERYYPEIKLIRSTAQEIPLPNDGVDLIFTRSVLQHISPGEIEAAVEEIARITTDDSRLLLCEATTGTSNNQSFWPRDKNEYRELFQGFELVDSWKRDAPAKQRENNRERMTFVRN